MCRILFARSIVEDKHINSKEKLKLFANIAKESKEFQGDGWGVAWKINDEWDVYKSESPIWLDSFNHIPNADILLVHARSAFNNTGPDISVTMPYMSDNKLFIFNGELRGVKIKSPGKIGAEKLFNYIIKLNNGDLLQTMKKATKIIEKKSDYIRALNCMLVEDNKVYFTNYFNEDPDYFTMHKKETESELIICSEPLDDSHQWESIGNRVVGVQ